MIKTKKSFYIYFALAAILLLPLAMADITINKQNKGSDVISGMNNAALFDLTIKNTGTEDSVEIYSLAGMIIQPRGPINVPNGEILVELKAYPNDILREQKGTYNFEYQIKSQNVGIINDELIITIVELKDALNFNITDVHLNDNLVRVNIKNLRNAHIDNVKLSFSSVLFSGEKILSLEPHETVVVDFPVNNRNANEITAGRYVLNVDAVAGNANAKFEVPFNYIQKESTSSSEKNEGFIFKTNYLEKTNNGNVPVLASIELKKDVISRLFTIYSVEPSSAKRSGIFVYYKWDKELAPAQSFAITARTNYTFPFLFILLIAAIASSVYIYSRTAVVVNKKVSYVKTHGGEFALKVKIQVKAKKYVENLKIIDKLPGMTTLYEKFGIKPNKIDSATRRLFWDIERLNAGEERVFSYIIYSKVRVVGRFELPTATVIFEREGKTHEVLSNRTFFVSDVARDIE